MTKIGRFIETLSATQASVPDFEKIGKLAHLLAVGGGIVDSRKFNW